jgi:rare lipoprotein A
MKKFKVLAPGAAVLLAYGLTAVVNTVSAKDIHPEIVSRAWTEHNQEIASVCLNGKELIAFRSALGSEDAVEEAEELAVKLQEMVADKKFDINQVLPGRDGDAATIKVEGNTVISFDPYVGEDNDRPGTAYLEASVKMVNALRTAYGVPTLPSSFPDLKDKTALSELKGHLFSGRASWYGPQFHGRRTSDGHRFDMDKLTAAHRSLPFGTKLLVMNRKTGNTCVVEVNDRGPFIDGRVIDLSRGAARQLNMISSGVAMVDCLVIGSR